ncbi:DNA polymerase III subunit epsilon [Burkholderia ubonensis]|uniref:exonuclease domain-containing protein n=1 Tax=Burkholderia ubonensis TaxID=101571 RepID=UPI0007576CB8|nr:exonuclease domain-containing protein [Burkholderia ubonensis]KVV37789.1 DNA polymerase III subunit epsilon [Burkholderia ubonensis]
MSDSRSTDPACEQPLVFVDLETTGGSSAEHRITEIGVVEIGPLGVSTWTSLVNPGQPIPPFIQQLTGISDAMVRDAPSFASLAPALFERLDGKLFVAHNASFDRGFLRAEFERIGLAFNPDVLCTVRLSRALFPRESRHGLDALIQRHGLVPSARHRALADADLLWQFWRHLHETVPLERLRDQITRTTRHFRLAGGLTEAWLDTAPAGCGAYALFGEADEPLYVGRSVRVRQRLRALLTGERRSSKELRLAQQVRRVEWRETGNELGAMLAEAQWVARLRPTFNRRPADAARAGAAAPWPFDGAVAFEAHGERRLFHVIEGWRYLGAVETLGAAARLAVDEAAGTFEPFTYRLLQTHLARGLQLIPLAAFAPAGQGAARRSPAPA